jgi:uncharacterized protein (TIGR00251 family)
MRIKIRLHPGASEDKIKEVSKDNYEVWIQQHPVQGKANVALLRFMKKHFKALDVKLLWGLKSRKKILEIVE